MMPCLAGESRGGPVRTSSIADVLSIAQFQTEDPVRQHAAVLNERRGVSQSGMPEAADPKG